VVVVAAEEDTTSNTTAQNTEAEVLYHPTAVIWVEVPWS